MKKRHAIGLGLFLLAIPTYGFSASLDNTDPGKGIELTGDDVGTSGQDFKFQPSPNVRTLGTTTAASFSLAAFNQSAAEADGGEAYGLASDVSGTYILDISETAADSVTIGDGTDGKSTDFSADWKVPADGSATAVDPDAG